MILVLESTLFGSFPTFDFVHLQFTINEMCKMSHYTDVLYKNVKTRKTFVVLKCFDIDFKTF